LANGSHVYCVLQHEVFRHETFIYSKIQQMMLIHFQIGVEAEE
jgi:hypothetical protein